MDEIEVTAATGTVVEHAELPTFTRTKDLQRAGALARSFRTLTPEELGRIRGPRALGTSLLFGAHRRMYFDLWTALEHLAPVRTDVAVQLEFSVSSASTDLCYLGIGANDSLLVWNGDRLVFGVTGQRENRYTHHIVPLKLPSGRSRVRILFQRNEAWDRIPADHGTDEWATNIQLFSSKAVAQRRRGQRVAHPFDSSVIRTLEDLRIDNHCDGTEEVEVLDLRGNRVALGQARPQGGVRWEYEAPIDAYPFIGVARITGDIGAPVVVCGPLGIEQGLEKLAEGAEGIDGAWGFRLRHLLKPQFKSSREDYWNNWGQKLAISAVKAFAPGTLGEAAQECPSLAVEIGTFTSTFDRTNQYYRYFRSPGVSGPRITAVIIPTAPAEMRPYLELIADLQNTERTAGLAAANGLDIVWAGGVSPDYGGKVARHEVREAISAYLTAFPPGPDDLTVLVGACSAAVTALGLVSDGLPVDGAVLWTPVVERWRQRWGREPSPLPHVAGDAERTDTRFNALKDCPILVYWDSDAPGHGDKAGTLAFQASAKSNDCLLDAIWVTPTETRPLWGPREAMSIQEWMEWMRTLKPSKRHDPVGLAQLPQTEKPGTVKEALLRGFVSVGEASSSHFLERWLDQVATYRGARASLAATHEAVTQVRSAEYTNSDLLDLLRGPLGSDVVMDEEARSMLSSQPYWGFRLVEDGPTAIELLTSPGLAHPPPPVDILVDGSCRRAVWVLDNGRWRLALVSL